jgi:hypothetical protein
MRVYIVVEIGKECPAIVGVFKKKADAEKVAYSNSAVWCNIVEKEVQS